MRHRLSAPGEPTGRPGAWPATITRVDPVAGVYALVPRATGLEVEWGPLVAVGGPYAPGDAAIAVGAEDRLDDLIIIGKVGNVPIPPGVVTSAALATALAAYTTTATLDATYATDAQLTAAVAAEATARDTAITAAIADTYKAGIRTVNLDASGLGDIPHGLGRAPSAASVTATQQHIVRITGMGNTNITIEARATSTLAVITTSTIVHWAVFS